MRRTVTQYVECGDPRSEFGQMVPARGIRGVLYGACFLALVLWATVGYGLVYLQILPPDPTDDYCGITAFLALWLPVWAFVDNKGERRSSVQKWEEFVFMWILTSGLCQVGWELPFVLLKVDHLQPIQSTKTLAPSELWAWPFWMYGSGDTRYMRQHSASHATETMLAISGFFELAAVWMMHHRRHYKTALIIAALTHWGFFWANTSVIYIAEVYDNYQSCLLYTSDAADEEDSVDLGGRRIIKKKKKNNNQV
eukprot:TRINITY_DN19492_c0_g1_i4.p1 TRINITY_DN19492_c0_g1~~TRINITY_DN19492_c0_g1_i4.p1  ORF type:complete len:253 (-),score=58.29 TRINITY_DN19492_c0_g1_i4:108-866(-)